MQSGNSDQENRAAEKISIVLRTGFALGQIVIIFHL